jgi:hypothetical protein
MNWLALLNRKSVWARHPGANQPASRVWQPITCDKTQQAEIILVMDLCRCLAMLNIGIMKDGVGDIVNKIFN